MNYYIATDKFGNYDLAHYGVKGMKWGEVHEDQLVGANYARAKAQADGQKRTQALVSQQQAMAAVSKYQTDGRKRTAAQQISSQAKLDPKVQAQYEATIQNESQKAAEAAGGNSDDAKKLADANTKYQTALMNMQLLARSSLANGVSLGQNPEYLAARKEVIKAKYELDKLKLDQQQKAAENPLTYAEEKQAMDSQAKKKLAEDKKEQSSSNESKSSKLDEIYKKQQETLGSYGIKSSKRKTGQ